MKIRSIWLKRRKLRGSRKKAIATKTPAGCWLGEARVENTVHEQGPLITSRGKVIDKQIGNRDHCLTDWKNERLSLGKTNAGEGLISTRGGVCSQLHLSIYR